MFFIFSRPFYSIFKISSAQDSHEMCHMCQIRLQRQRPGTKKKQINKRQDVDYKQTLEICDCEIMDSSGVKKDAVFLTK